MRPAQGASQSSTPAAAPPATATSYSQFGEDLSARHALRSVSHGFYVDIGAHHPWKLSNTAVFHLAGWDGINVEPKQEAIAQFERHRPHAINLRAAIHNDLEVVTLYKFDGGLIDTVLPHRVDTLSRSRNPAGEETVPAMSLNQLFERYVPANVRVDYLSVDIEGYDETAVLAFDLERHQPVVVCVELHKFDADGLQDQPMVRHLLDAGYQLYAINVLSLTFVHADSAQRLGLWQLFR